jgi:1-acyl-sn-glycerol-3-phosphate acyltransferase
MRVFVDGDEPTSPVALVCNHLSYVDIIALWSIHPGVFVARADVASWPLIGQVGRLIGTIFIDRDRKRDLLRVIPEMEVHLAEGRSVIFFPEGTSSCGARVLPFRSSLFEAAARGGVSVVGASLQLKTPRTSPSADLSVCWWGDMAFPPHVFALLHIDGIDACVRFANTSHLGSDRKLLCRLAKDSVEKSFSPTSPGAHDEPSSITAPTRQGREQLS